MCFLLFILAGFSFVVWGFQQAGIKIREVPALTNPSKAPLPQPIQVYSSDGVKLGELGNQQRRIVNYQQIPAVIREASVAIEDQRFYEHRGVDFQALARAAYVDLKSGSAAQGASTITMQYIRNVYLDFTKTVNRKFQEVALALQLESIWTKNRILTAYLNTVYYGNGSYGVEAAAKQYFDKPALELTLAQASLLAGVTKDPSAYDPRKHLGAARKRQAVVIDEMYAQGYISRREAVDAKQAPLDLRNLEKREAPREPQLLQFAINELNRTLDPIRRRQGGLRVTTSFRMSTIYRARKTLRAVYRDVSGEKPIIAASFVEPMTGRIAILAHNRRGGFFDFATQAYRQPGSVVKVYTTAQLIRNGGQLADPVDNSPLQVDSGDSTYTVAPTQDGVSTVVDALRFSQNPAFFRLYQQADPQQVLGLQRKLGLTKMDANPAAALGGVRRGATTLEVAGSMAAFAADGRFRPPHAITKIEDFLGNQIHSDRAAPSRQVLAPEYARQLNLATRQVVTRGLPQLRESLTLDDEREIAGKTGTTEDNADAWFTGYTPQLAGAVWTGYEKDRIPLRNLPGAPSGEVFGATLPAQAFDQIARPLLKGKPRLRFPRPTGIQKIPSIIGKPVREAQELLAQYRFSQVEYVAKFSARAAREEVLEVSPLPLTWVTLDTPLRVVYQTNQRPTPTLVGISYLKALDILGRFAKLSPRMVVSDKPTGTILTQYPYAGDPLRAGERVRVTIATSQAPPQTIIRRLEYVPTDSELAELRRQLAEEQSQPPEIQEQIRVPDLIGLTTIQAQRIARSIGLSSQVATPGSIVISQSVAAGSGVIPGTIIELTARR